MALISARTIISSLSFFHLTLGFFFLTSPVSLADQSLVYVVGDAMGMPTTPGFDVPSPALAFLAVVLAFMGITDIATLSLPEEAGMVHYWGTQAPVRVLLSMASVFYTFFFSESRWHGKQRPYSSHHTYAQTGFAGDLLKNRVFFTFMFLEMVSWFWLWVTLREEHTEVLRRKARRRSQSYN